MDKVLNVLLAILGPLWLPLYWLWQLLVGLVGVCYYLVVERTRKVLFPERVAASPVRVRWFLVPLLLVGLVPALTIQLLVAMVGFLIWWHRLLGGWQTGFKRTFPAVLAGIVAEAVFVLVFVGSQYHPLPLKVLGYTYSEDLLAWYRAEGTDPVRMLLAGPILIGAFSLVLVPTVFSRLWSSVRMWTFLPAAALSVYSLLDTIRAFNEPQINARWITVAEGMFIAAGILALMALAWRTLHRSTALRQFVWFSAIRLLEKKRIALFSLAAVMLCTAMLLIISSVMGGFAEQVREKSHGLMGDIILEGDTARGFPYYEGFIEQLTKMDIVAKATPIIYTGGLLRVQKPHNPNAFWTNPIQIQGIDLTGKVAVTRFGKGLNRYGRNPKWVNLSDPVKPPERPEAESLYGIIFGLDVKGFSYRDPNGEYQRFIPLHWPCTISVIPLTASGKLVDINTPARTQKFYLMDDSRTGVYDIDSTTVYVDFKVLQKLLYMDRQETADGKAIPARTHQIHVKLKPGVPLNDKSAQQIKIAWINYTAHLDDPLLENVEINRWEEYNSQFISAVENEKRLMIMIFGIISIVAVFLILAIFYMIVVEKTRDIGILKSIGASATQIAAIFLTYGGVIGLVGSILGTILGYHFVKHINGIQNWLINVFGWRVWNREIYSFDEIPSRVRPEDAVIIVLAAIVASVIGALIPAIRAARMNPVEALRYE